MTSALLIRDANVITMDPARRRASAVLAVAGRIAAVGDAEVLSHPAAATAAVIPGRGRTVAPAFIDAHIHLLAAAARLEAVDCAPDKARSIADIQAAIAARASGTPAGQWVRAAGYDDMALVEQRHPSRHDLDQAAPAHPVRLVHRTGHALVLNSLALAVAGIDGATPEPPGGHMERDLDTGEPTGLLLEMDDLVTPAVPPLPFEDLARAVASLDRELLAAGVTFVEDATATNGLEEWALVERLVDAGHLTVKVSMMEGMAHLGGFPELGAAGRLRRGGVKLQPRELAHETAPGPAEMARLVAGADAAGRRVAVHASGRAGLAAAIHAYAALGARRVLAARHRVEHAGLCSEESAHRLAALGATVVTQPGFLYWSGDVMRARLSPEEAPDLYPLRRLLTAGVAVAGSSDAPVSPPLPLDGMRGAAARRTRSGVTLTPEQRLSGGSALALFTRDAAAALGLEGERGTLRPGLEADVVVLSGDPTDPGADWDALRVEVSVQAGKVVFERAAAASLGRGRASHAPGK